MGNTDKFDSIANSYDNPERTRIAMVASDAIKEYLGDTRSKSAIDFGCGDMIMGEKKCKQIPRKVSKAAKDLSTSINKKTKRQAGETLAEHKQRYH